MENPIGIGKLEHMKNPNSAFGKSPSVNQEQSKNTNQKNQSIIVHARRCSMNEPFTPNSFDLSPETQFIEAVNRQKSSPRNLKPSSSPQDIEPVIMGIQVNDQEIQQFGINSRVVSKQDQTDKTQTKSNVTSTFDNRGKLNQHFDHIIDTESFGPQNQDIAHAQFIRRINHPQQNLTKLKIDLQQIEALNSEPISIGDESKGTALMRDYNQQLKQFEQKLKSSPKAIKIGSVIIPQLHYENSQEGQSGKKMSHRIPQIRSTQTSMPMSAQDFYNKQALIKTHLDFNSRQPNITNIYHQNRQALKKQQVRSTNITPLKSEVMMMNRTSFPNFRQKNSMAPMFSQQSSDAQSTHNLGRMSLLYQKSDSNRQNILSKNSPRFLQKQERFSNISFQNPFIGEVKVIEKTRENQSLLEQSKSDLSRDTYDKLNSLAGIHTKESANMHFNPSQISQRLSQQQHHTFREQPAIPDAKIIVGIKQIKNSEREIVNLQNDSLVSTMALKDINEKMQFLNIQEKNLPNDNIQPIRPLQAQIFKQGKLSCNQQFSPKSVKKQLNVFKKELGALNKQSKHTNLVDILKRSTNRSPQPRSSSTNSKSTFYKTQVNLMASMPQMSLQQVINEVQLEQNQFENLNIDMFSPTDNKVDKALEARDSKRSKFSKYSRMAQYRHIVPVDNEISQNAQSNLIMQKIADQKGFLTSMVQKKFMSPKRSVDSRIGGFKQSQDGHKTENTEIRAANIDESAIESTMQGSRLQKLVQLQTQMEQDSSKDNIDKSEKLEQLSDKGPSSQNLNDDQTSKGYGKYSSQNLLYPGVSQNFQRFSKESRDTILNNSSPKGLEYRRETQQLQREKQSSMSFKQSNLNGQFLQSFITSTSKMVNPVAPEAIQNTSGFIQNKPKSNLDIKQGSSRFSQSNRKYSQGKTQTSFRQTKGGGFGGFKYSMKSSSNSLMIKMQQQSFSFANDKSQIPKESHPTEQNQDFEIHTVPGIMSKSVDKSGHAQALIELPLSQFQRMVNEQEFHEIKGIVQNNQSSQIEMKKFNQDFSTESDQNCTPEAFPSDCEIQQTEIIEQRTRKIDLDQLKIVSGSKTQSKSRQSQLDESPLCNDQEYILQSQHYNQYQNTHPSKNSNDRFQIQQFFIASTNADLGTVNKPVLAGREGIMTFANSQIQSPKDKNVISVERNNWIKLDQNGLTTINMNSPKFGIEKNSEKNKESPRKEEEIDSQLKSNKGGLKLNKCIKSQKDQSHPQSEEPTIQLSNREKKRRLSAEYIDIDLLVPNSNENSQNQYQLLQSHGKLDEDSRMIGQPNPWDRSQLFTPQQPDDYDDPFQRSQILSQRSFRRKSLLQIGASQNSKNKIPKVRPEIINQDIEQENDDQFSKQQIVSHHTVTLPSQEENSKERKQESPWKGTDEHIKECDYSARVNFNKTQGFKENRVMIATNDQIKINQTSLLSSHEQSSTEQFVPRFDLKRQSFDTKNRSQMSSHQNRNLQVIGSQFKPTRNPLDQDQKAQFITSQEKKILQKRQLEVIELLKQQKQTEKTQFYSKAQQQTGEDIRIIGDPVEPKNQEGQSQKRYKSSEPIAFDANYMQQSQKLQNHNHEIPSIFVNAFGGSMFHNRDSPKHLSRSRSPTLMMPSQKLENTKIEEIINIFHQKHENSPSRDQLLHPFLSSGSSKAKQDKMIKKIQAIKEIKFHGTETQNSSRYLSTRRGQSTILNQREVYEYGTNQSLNRSIQKNLMAQQTQVSPRVYQNKSVLNSKEMKIQTQN